MTAVKCDFCNADFGEDDSALETCHACGNLVCVNCREPAGNAVVCLDCVDDFVGGNY